MHKKKQYHRSTIVLLPEDEKALEALRDQAGLSSRTQAVRFALRSALRELDQDRIRNSYIKTPESTTESKAAQSLTLISARGMKKEDW